MAAMELEPGAEKWHGTLHGYRNQGCRCTVCRQAQSAAAKDYRRRQAKLREAEGNREIKEEPAPYVPERRRRLPDD